MGHDNNNAGIHLIPHGYRIAYDNMDTYDKYAGMIVENRNKENDHLQRRTNKKLLSTETNVVLWDVRGQSNQCKCSNILDYSDNIQIQCTYRKVPNKIIMAGKLCRSCGKVYVVKSELLKKISTD